MFYIEISKRFLEQEEEIGKVLNDLSKGKDEKDFSVVYLTDKEKEIVDFLRDKEVAFTIIDKEAGGGVTSPDTY